MTTTTAPPGVEPQLWLAASWYARLQWLRRHPQPQLELQLPPAPPRRDRCPAGHDVTDPANVYRPPNRPGKADCRTCRRDRARERQRTRRAAERAARLTSSTPAPTTRQETAA